MKNRYLKGAHISERKVKELLKLFCEDLTATQIANITGISRITVNAYLKLLRTQIAQFSDEQNPTLINNRSAFYLDFYNGTKPDEEGHTPSTKKPLYGIYRVDDKIHTEEISGLDSSFVHDWLKRKVTANESDRHESRLTMYSAIADFNSIKIYRTQFQTGTNGKFRVPMDEFDIFWGMLKSRLIKFRGLNRNTLLLHVKETEFRYNNRNTELYDMLLTILHNRPLHFSRIA
jgi:transposase